MIHIHHLEGERLNKLTIIALFAIITTPCVAKTKVYGELHASYDNIFEVGSKSKDNLALNNSFIGFKGSTEIKKDVSFIYQISWGVSNSGYEDINNLNLNSSTYRNSGFNNRNQVIGLASPSGALIVGRFDTPFKTVGRKADLFWHSQLGQNRNITNANNWDLRADKIVIAQSPVVKGFQGSLAYASDIADTSRVTQNASAISANGFYKKGEFLVGAAYEQHDLDSSSEYQSASTKALRLSLTYRNGPLKLLGFYQKEDNDFSVTTQPNAIVIGAGVAYTKGKRTLKAQFYSRNDDLLSKNSDLIAIGYDYKLSKQLDVYAQMAKANHSFNLGAYSLSNSNEASDSHGFSIGLKYKF